MENRELNILSIDFDFFQIVDTETIYECYPDGLDLPTKLTEITWAGHYRQPVDRDRLFNVKANENLIQEVQELAIENARNSRIPFILANSHKHIYKFIKQELARCKYKSVNIYNLDMHHDYTNRGSKVDCGNWLGHAVKDFPDCTATWVMNSISLKLADESEIKTLHKVKTLRCLKDVKFDMIYLCRSDSWTPPHLDNHFTELAYNLGYEFSNCFGDSDVLQPRNLRVYM